MPMTWSSAPGPLRAHGTLTHRYAIEGDFLFIDSQMWAKHLKVLVATHNLISLTLKFKHGNFGSIERIYKTLCAKWHA